LDLQAPCAAHRAPRQHGVMCGSALPHCWGVYETLQCQQVGRQLAVCGAETKRVAEEKESAAKERQAAADKAAEEARSAAAEQAAAGQTPAPEAAPEAGTAEAPEAAPEVSRS